MTYNEITYLYTFSKSTNGKPSLNKKDQETLIIRISTMFVRPSSEEPEKHLNVNIIVTHV